MQGKFEYNHDEYEYSEYDGTSLLRIRTFRAGEIHPVYQAECFRDVYEVVPNYPDRFRYSTPGLGKVNKRGELTHAILHRQLDKGDPTMTTYAYKILPDTDAESPREWDNLGHMLCKHGRYNLGDADAEQELYSILDTNYGRLNKEEKEFVDYERNDDVYAVNMFLKYNLGILLPLYLFDHSGLAMSTTSGQFRAQDSMGWDWGLVGFIFVSWAEVRKEWSVKSISRRIKTLATNCLVGEVETYDQYLQGDVYGYIIYAIPDEVLEDECLDASDLDPNSEDWDISEDEYEEKSCWGFFGYTHTQEEVESIMRNYQGEPA